MGVVRSLFGCAAIAVVLVSSQPTAAAGPAAQTVEASPIGKLMGASFQPDKLSERELRQIVETTLRVYENGEELVRPVLPADVAYLVTTILANGELLRRDGATLPERATHVRLLVSVALGMDAPAPELQAALRMEAEHGGDAIRRRARAIRGAEGELAQAAAAEARVHGAAILEAVPKHPATLRALGELELRMGEGGRAAELLGRYLSGAPDDARARLWRGVALLTGSAEVAAGRLAAVSGRLDPPQPHVQDMPRVSSDRFAAEPTAIRPAHISADPVNEDESVEDGDSEIAAAIAADPSLRWDADAERQRIEAERALAALTKKAEGPSPLSVTDSLALVQALLDVPGHTPEALERTRDLLRRAPRDPAVLRTAAGVFLATQRLSEWRSVLAMDKPLPPNDPTTLEIRVAGRYMELAELLRQGPDAPGVDEARARLREELRAYATPSPEKAQLVSALADVAELFGLTAEAGGREQLRDRARALATRLLDRDPRSEANVRVAVLLLLAAGDTSSAGEIARTALDGAGEAEHGDALFAAQVDLFIAAQSGEPEGLERALTLLRAVSGDESQDEGLRLFTKAQALDLKALLESGPAADALTDDAVEAANQALARLDLGTSEGRRRAAALHVNLAYHAIGRGDRQALSDHVVKARRLDPASPAADLVAAMLAVADREPAAARDLLSHARILQPGPRLSLAIDKWSALVADQLRSRVDFIGDLEAAEAVWDDALPAGTPEPFEDVVLSGDHVLGLRYDVKGGLQLDVRQEQRIYLVRAQRSLKRDTVRSLLSQLGERAKVDGTTEEGPP